MIPDYTLIIGVDHKHLNQLSITWPTWKRHKPSLLKVPLIVFFDRSEVTVEQIVAVVDHPNMKLVLWPPLGVCYTGDEHDKFSHPQRYKMLSGFVHIAGAMVKTPYYLKLDTDVVATGLDDWIAEDWFYNFPAIISHPWNFTRPPNQMIYLDDWVQSKIGMGPGKELLDHPPLKLMPQPGEDRLGHQRIISWCGFFETEFTRECSRIAHEYSGYGQLPVPTQDGYLWYVAKRLGRGIVRANLKSRGWQQWNTYHNIKQHAQQAMEIEV